MNSQLEQISKRIKELREILGYTQEQVAAAVNVPIDNYAQYENAKADIPIGVLYDVAYFMHIDATELLTGEAPRMSEYTITRKGHGVSVERYKGYSFSSLAYNYLNRKLEPMIVDLLPKDSNPELVSHAGQEFNYVLEGTIIVKINNKEFVLNAGDSIFFDSSAIHGQKAINGPAKFLTVITE